MPPPHAHQALKAHIDRPLELLEGRGAVLQASVHGARKQLKRARASLRMLRDAVGSRAYREENRRLRDAARPLAETRDADVMIGTVSALMKEKAFRPHRAALAKLRVTLMNERAAAACRVPLDDIRRSLEQSRARVSQWRMPHDMLPIARTGLERIYRRGRKAYARAADRPTDAGLHELRKQVKYLGAALQAIEPPHAAKVIERAEELAEMLGLDHDLAVLRKRLADADRALVRLVGERREDLQQRASPKARKLFRRKPAVFVAHILQP
ncbi:MAG: CHAD domain-containing protein [Betaproteobacteria bacterium]